MGFFLFFIYFFYLKRKILSANVMEKFKNTMYVLNSKTRVPRGNPVLYCEKLYRKFLRMLGSNSSLYRSK